MFRFNAQKIIISAEKIIHIIGICGIGMSGIAQVLSAMGYNIQGSDLTLSSNYNYKLLEAKGIKVFLNHNPENIREAEIIVKSNAISENNPQIVEAKAQNKIILSRLEILQYILKNKRVIAISGCHGKTTTTAMIAEIFLKSGLAPTVLCGGIMNDYNNNVIINNININNNDNNNDNDHNLFIIEADESDDTFFNIPVETAVVTNIDADHLDFHGSLENIYQKFKRFIAGAKLGIIPYEESLGLISSRPNIQAYDYNSRGKKKLSAISNKGWKTFFNYELHEGLGGVHSFELNIPGEHNINNAMAAIATACSYNIDIEIIKKALASFSGVKRRLSIIGKFKGNIIVDDYAHHPCEILSSIKAIKKAQVSELTSNYSNNNNKNRNNNNGNDDDSLIIVIQPHRYSRVRALFKDYIEVLATAKTAAKYVLLLPVYSAGEPYEENFNSKALYKALEDSSYGNNSNVFFINDFKEMQAKIVEIKVKNGVILCMGAGTITEYAHNLVDQL